MYACMYCTDQGDLGERKLLPDIIGNLVIATLPRCFPAL